MDEVLTEIINVTAMSTKCNAFMNRDASVLCMEEQKLQGQDRVDTAKLLRKPR